MSVAAAALKNLSAGGVRLSQLPPLALYVHIPWCVRKCPYCDFNSHEAKDDVPEDAYVEALVRDLEQALPAIWGRRVTSIFFGGGTPSLFSARAIDALLSAFRARLAFAPECEITLEANPGTFEAEKFRDFRSAGVNRLSVGIQSFDAGQLKALGRIHDDAEARRAVDIALERFDNVNLDLMYALPGQTLDRAEADLRTAVSFGAPHLSFYHLTIEPNTLFHRHPPSVPDDDAAAAMQEMIESRLADAGYVHYETSAYARPGRECRHNLNYWRFGDYLGIGAGAHSKLSFPDRIVRQMRTKQPTEYLKRVSDSTPVRDEHEVSRGDVVFEFMMNALRLTEGFPVALFAERTGLPITAAEKPLAQAEARGLIERDHERIRPTELGRRFLNDLLQMFLAGDK
ncbi:MAG: YggW family oxidoreductase [Betaproteobacteria bacterium RBG_16_64_18]|nr:MAG: YggW family oxidoreductase [Betaproteobacteria bacterium RBG_16_64_18]